MRCSIFLISLLHFLFIFCLPSFAQSISCWESMGGYRCSDGTMIYKNIFGITIDKPSEYSYLPQRPKQRDITVDDLYICSAESGNRDNFRNWSDKFNQCLSEIVTKPAPIPSVTCEQNSKNNTECFDKVTGRKWEIVP